MMGKALLRSPHICLFRHVRHHNFHPYLRRRRRIFTRDFIWIRTITNSCAVITYRELWCSAARLANYLNLSRCIFSTVSASFFFVKICTAVTTELWLVEVRARNRRRFQANPLRCRNLQLSVPICQWIAEVRARIRQQSAANPLRCRVL